ncbi:GntR family transcriptional regulator [bacterium]|nr:GntR family transcriptional regulator [bacterium]
MIVDRNSPIPQYYQLQNWLIEQIDLGVFKPGERIPTEEELVRITGLCRATVRQAISNLVNLAYLKPKRRFGTFVLERNPDDRKKSIIGILVPDIRSGCSSELARGAEDEAARNKHSIMLCNTDDLFFKAEYYADRLIKEHVTGVVYVPIADTEEKNRTIIERFRQHDIPVVLADRILPDLEIDYVTTDNFHGAYAMTKHLLKMGHRRIAIIYNGLVSSERFRFEGYCKALQDNRIPLDESLISNPQTLFTEQVYSKSVLKILKQRKDHLAVFAAHDQIALLCYSIAREKRLSIPEDLSLVGYDNLPQIRAFSFGLTTIHQPIYEIGRKSIHVILSRLRDKRIKPKQIVLKSWLVERHSVQDLGVLKRSRRYSRTA